ncbi:MAG: hypothetical protein M0P63_13135 [Azoarcus sp.]|nr:hypothetical protein [Azoarcus sp.]
MMVAVCHIATAQNYVVTTSEFAVDHELEHHEVTHFVGVRQMDADGPDVFGFEVCRLTGYLSLVPGFPTVAGIYAEQVYANMPTTHYRPRTITGKERQ